MSEYLVMLHNGVEMNTFTVAPFVCKYYINTNNIFLSGLYLRLKPLFSLEKNLYHHVGLPLFFSLLTRTCADFDRTPSCDYDVRCDTESVHSLIARARARGVHIRFECLSQYLRPDVLSTCKKITRPNRQRGRRRSHWKTVFGRVKRRHGRYILLPATPHAPVLRGDRVWSIYVAAPFTLLLSLKIVIPKRPYPYVISRLNNTDREESKNEL